MPMRTMHRVNGNMFQDLLRYEEEAREMTEQKDVLVQADMTVGSLAAKHARTWGCSDPSAVSMLEAFGKQLLRVEHAQGTSGQPVAWLTAYDGHTDATTDPDTVRIWRETLHREVTPLYAAALTPAVCAEAEVVAAVLCAADRNVSLADIHPRTRAAYVLMARSILQKFDVRPK